MVDNFLNAYQSKDIIAIAPMLADDIVLRDWNAEVVGHQDAIVEFKKNFSNVASLSIKLKHMYSGQNCAAAELEIVIDESEVLNVVDVITFNSAGKISSIRAFKGL